MMIQDHPEKKPLLLQPNQKERTLSYRESCLTEEEAMSLADSFIKGGVIQQVGNLWYVWQIN